MNVDPGFRSENVGGLHMAIPRSKYQSDEQSAAFYRRIVDRVVALSVVISAGMVHRPWRSSSKAQLGAQRVRHAIPRLTARAPTEGLLHGVAPLDPVSLAAATALLFGAALAASYSRPRRALTDPAMRFGRSDHGSPQTIDPSATSRPPKSRSLTAGTDETSRFQLSTLCTGADSQDCVSPWPANDRGLVRFVRQRIQQHARWLPLPIRGPEPALGAGEGCRPGGG